MAILREKNPLPLGTLNELIFKFVSFTQNRPQYYHYITILLWVKIREGQGLKHKQWNMSLHLVSWHKWMLIYDCLSILHISAYMQEKVFLSKERSICPVHDTRKHICCGGKLWHKKGKYRLCCGKQVIDSRFEICCDGDITTLPYKGNTYDRELMNCCGQKAYTVM